MNLTLLGVIVLIATVIATAVDKTWENMKKCSEYFQQIKKDLLRINQIIEETERLFEGRLK